MKERCIRMKKIISLILLIIFCVMFISCGNPNQTPETPSPTPPSKGNVVSPIKPGGDFEVGGNYGN